jgi:hypothetical protein
MKIILCIITLFIFCISCKTEKKTSTLYAPNSANRLDEYIYIDTLVKKDSISIYIQNDEVVILNIGSFTKKFNLKTMNIPIKTIELVWVNKEYACIVTWWSQAQSRHIFVPMNLKNEFIYYNKDIEKTDSLSNDIVYIDSIEEDKIQFKVENLLNKKSKTIPIEINRNNGIYPFYENIILTQDSLAIITATEEVNISLE